MYGQSKRKKKNPPAHAPYLESSSGEVGVVGSSACSCCSNVVGWTAEVLLLLRLILLAALLLLLLLLVVVVVVVLVVGLGEPVAGVTVDSWSCMSIMWSPRRMVRLRGALPERKSLTWESLRDSRACMTLCSGRWACKESSSWCGCRPRCPGNRGFFSVEGTQCGFANFSTYMLWRDYD